MREQAADLARLQALLDRSYETAGVHLRSIITAERRLTAERLCDRLQGMCLLVLATVTADGRPIAGPVDGIFYRGEFYFGSSPHSVRFRHIRRNPAVSATHLPSEELSVTVHGRAVEVETTAVGNPGFRQALREIYEPTIGDGWERLVDSGSVYARIEAERMFTFKLTAT